MKNDKLLQLIMVGIITNQMGCTLQEFKVKNEKTGEFLTSKINPQPLYLSTHKYDNSNNLLTDKNINQMIEPTVKIKTITTLGVTAKDTENNTQHKYITTLQNWGTGLLLKNTSNYYLLTANHVLPSIPKRKIYINSDKHTIVDSKLLAMVTFLEVGDNKIGYKILTQNPKKDIAILQVYANELKPAYFKGEFAQKDDLKRGDITYTVGFPSSFGKILTQGIISNPHFNDNGQDYILSTAPINPGNSGGPLYTLSKGAPVLSGMSVITYQGLEGMHQFVGIGDIKSELKKAGLEKLIK